MAALFEVGLVILAPMNTPRISGSKRHEKKRRRKRWLRTSDLVGVLLLLLLLAAVFLIEYFEH